MIIDKKEWALSLKPGDKVYSDIREATKQEKLTVEYVLTNACYSSGITIKLKEYQTPVDIGWINPIVVETETMEIDLNYLTDLLAQINEVEAWSYKLAVYCGKNGSVQRIGSDEVIFEFDNLEELKTKLEKMLSICTELRDSRNKINDLEFELKKLK